jgi:hypothetical protein
MDSRVKMISWLVAGSFVLFGAVFAVDTAKVKETFVAVNLSLPPMTSVVLAIGPLGWFALGVLGAGCVILNDLRVHSRLLLAILALVVLAMDLYVAAAVFLLIIHASG